MGRMLVSGEQTQSLFFLLIQETSVREEKGLAQALSRQPTLGFSVFIRSKNIGGAPL